MFVGAALQIYCKIRRFQRTNVVKEGKSWCPGQDSNLHVLANTSPSSWRVYQFRHLGIVRSFSLFPTLKKLRFRKFFLQYKLLFEKVLQRYKISNKTDKQRENYFCRAESRNCWRKGEANMKSCSTSLSLCSTSSRLPRQAISPL